MSKLTEIRWHGRGGQGAKTAALLFGEAVLGQGKYMQAFPEYGPERMGAPVQSFNRISDQPITLHCHVTSPDIVVVLDPTLIGNIDVTQGLPENGIILINSSLPASKFREMLKLNGQKVYTVDASKIARETIGRDIPNTPMMGALVKVTGLLDFEEMLKDTRKKLEKKFRSRPEIIEGNIKAIQRAYDEVTEG
ncbi:MAG: 2-oxoacid:acceptor oxidoreductase family protein [Armatimonadota bacterium]|nr:2-oxoacid:acceptor oxidoreductase family protein [Armatimonadota bacterium]MDH7482154.1 2-oxoacid:acceptor oxidoreductase family protein [Armatimonadota bacterium]